MQLCDFCSTKKQTQEIYNDLQICKPCLNDEEGKSSVADSIEGQYTVRNKKERKRILLEMKITKAEEVLGILNSNKMNFF